MRESYGEGLATHGGPESCAGARKGSGEASIGVRAGRVLSRVILIEVQGADVVGQGGRQHRADR